MRNNCSKIRIVALLMVMLLGTINTWAWNVYFNTNGGTSCATITGSPGQVTLPQTTKDGYFLVGWFKGDTYVGRAGDVYKPTGGVTLTADWAEIEGTTTIGSNKKYTNSGEVFSKGYQIRNNQQREFTFRNSRRSDTNDRWANWNMWAYTSWRTDYANRKDYFYMDLAPCVRKHITVDDNFWSNYDATAVFIKQANGELTIMTDEDWTQFLTDMSNNAYVSVKVYNYDGMIRVYSVMQDSRKQRTYVYPYEYTKFEGYEDVWIHFSVDRTVLTDFKASNPVGVARVAYNLDYTTAYGPRNCSMTVTTPEGLELATGTALGKGDKVKYQVNLGYKWNLTKWGGVNVNVNPREIEVQDSHANDGWINPTATLEYTGVNITDNREFHLDFEGMSDVNLIKVVDLPDGSTNAPIGKPTDDQKGDFYLYGGNGRILHDDVFGNYYQNLAVNPNEYTASKSENFLRYILTDDEQGKIAGGINGKDGAKAASIGFWVNGRVAVDYELPLERGSMFSMFSDERFRKADNMNEKPRFMFDISCNGWVYSYMPKTTEEGDEYENEFFYGETAPVLEDGVMPKVSLFGRANYAHAQDQRQHKFYDDRRWHYVTYVAEEDLKKVTMYLDGEKTGELDTRTLGDMQNFDPDGDYPGRVWYLRNLVLGGFTPHGLFFEKQFYSDAALAYDDISIYSKALTQDEIKDIINEKGYNVTPKEWHFTEAVKAYGVSGEALDATTWASEGNGIYRLIKRKYSNGNEQPTDDDKKTLTSNGVTISSTEGLTFQSSSGEIYIDVKNGRIGLTRDAAVYIPKVENTEHLYFVAKPDDDVKYPLDHYDLYPYSAAVGDFYTRGVSLYGGGNGKEDYSILEAYKRTGMDKDCGFRVYKNHYNVSSNKNILWISDIMLSQYGLMYVSYTPDHRNIFGFPDKASVKYVDVNIENNTIPSVAFPQLLVTKAGSDALNIAEFSKDNAKGNPYIRFSSSAPHVATVDQNGKVTIKGIAGYATIKAELIFDNIHDGSISSAYQIRVTKAPKTRHAEENTTYDIAYKQTVMANDGSDAITMSLGGWAYTENSYSGTEGDDLTDDGIATDGWAKGYVFQEDNDLSPVDGFNTYSQGKQNAKSESYGNDDGRYVPTTQVVRNVTPWTLPCRGSYLKFDAEKPGVLTVYVLQNGNLDKSNINNDYSDQIHWRPVYITNERGVCVPRVQYDTNSKISENDNFFKEGRRRAQFIEEIEETYNQRLKNALLGLKNSNYDRFKLLLSRWENQGWKQKVIETGDGGYMIMSKGIVRYSFNVVPGQTYYVFSNDTKIGYAGYNFEEGKILYDNASLHYDTNPMYTAAVTTTPVVYKDELNYNPKLPEGINNMFSVPVEIQRSFKANTWSSICLPFSMNRKQLEENFGEGTSVVLLKQVINQGYKKGRVELIWHVNQDIIAGYPYFILPTKNVTKIKFNAPFRKDQDRYLETPYLAVGSNGKSFEHKSGYTYYDDYPYVFEGNFKDEEIPAGSYVMSNSGTLARVKNSVKAKLFRAYIRCIDVANAKPLTTMSFSESEGETTSIEELLQDNGIILESSDVYGVNGVKVRSNTHSLEGLSKGIYVVNGKKYVVK